MVMEDVELRQTLAELQEPCVELAADAGELHAEVEALRARLAEGEREHDAWRVEAEQVRLMGRALPGKPRVTHADVID